MTFLTKLDNYIDIERCIHSLKTALACLIGFMLTRFTHLPVDQWLIITIIVVMTAQINVGSMLQKSYMRFLSTIIGSIIAMLTLKAFGTDFIPIALVITLSVIFFSYIATGSNNFREAGTLGAVTVVIILVGRSPTMTTAVERCLEISAGILIAALVSQFILPINARTHLRRSQAETLQKLQDYYKAVMSQHDSNAHAGFNQKLEQPIVKSLTNQRALAQAAKRELLGEKFNPEHFQQFLQYEIEILRSLDFMHYAIERHDTTRTLLISSPSLKEFNDRILTAMQNISDIIEHPKQKNSGILIPNLATLKTETQQLGASLSSDEIATLNAFLFCADILVEQLKKLLVLYQIDNLDEILGKS